MPPTTQSRLLSDTLAMRETIEKDFYSSQRVLGYPAYDNFVKMGKEMSTRDFQRKWTIRVLDAGAGSVQSYTAFGETTFNRVDVMSQMSVTPTFWQSHTNCMYDSFVMDGFNDRSSDGFVYSLKEGDEDAAFEAHVSELDKAMLNVPYSVGADGLQGLLGVPYWAARSQTSGGVFTEQLEPSRAGIYTTLGDGTVTGTVANLNRALARNERARTVVATHDHRMSATLIETSARMLVRMNYRYLSEFNGKQGANDSTGNKFRIYMTLDWANAYRDLVNQLSGDRRGDYYMVNGVQIDSRTIVGTENMPTAIAALNPLFFVNHANCKFNPVEGKWAVTEIFRPKPSVYVMPKKYAGQMRCTTPTDGVGVIHGNW